MKKYVRYEVGTESGEFCTTIYKSAFAFYQSARESATLYGVNEMGDFSVIMSK